MRPLSLYFTPCNTVPDKCILLYPRCRHLDTDLHTLDFAVSDDELDRLQKYQSQCFTAYLLEELFSSYRKRKKLSGSG